MNTAKLKNIAKNVGAVVEEMFRENANSFAREVSTRIEAAADTLAILLETSGENVETLLPVCTTNNCNESDGSQTSSTERSKKAKDGEPSSQEGASDTSVQSEIAALQDAISTLHFENSTLRNEISARSIRNSSLQIKISALQVRSSFLGIEMAALSMENSSLRMESTFEKALLLQKNASP